MTTPRSAGRPKAISREMLEEAACELFLERGYAQTSVADITQRAGVSRATFFNYVDSKSDLLWATVDDAIAAISRALPPGSGEQETRAVLAEAASALAPGVAVLAMGNAEAMGVGEELLVTGAARQARLAAVLHEGLRGSGPGPLWADVRARSLAGAFFAALEQWAAGDPGVEPFADVLTEALAAVVGD